MTHWAASSSLSEVTSSVTEYVPGNAEPLDSMPHLMHKPAVSQHPPTSSSMTPSFCAHRAIQRHLASIVRAGTCSPAKEHCAPTQHRCGGSCTPQTIQSCRKGTKDRGQDGEPTKVVRAGENPRCHMHALLCGNKNRTSHTHQAPNSLVLPGFGY